MSCSKCPDPKAPSSPHEQLVDLIQFSYKLRIKPKTSQTKLIVHMFPERFPDLGGVLNSFQRIREICKDSGDLKWTDLGANAEDPQNKVYLIELKKETFPEPLWNEEAQAVFNAFVKQGIPEKCKNDTVLAFALHPLLCNSKTASDIDFSEYAVGDIMMMIKEARNRDILGWPDGVPSTDQERYYIIVKKWLKGSVPKPVGKIERDTKKINEGQVEEEGNDVPETKTEARNSSSSAQQSSSQPSSRATGTSLEALYQHYIQAQTSKLKRGNSASKMETSADKASPGTPCDYEREGADSSSSFATQDKSQSAATGFAEAGETQGTRTGHPPGTTDAPRATAEAPAACASSRDPVLDKLLDVAKKDSAKTMYGGSFGGAPDARPHTAAVASGAPVERRDAPGHRAQAVQEPHAAAPRNAQQDHRRNGAHGGRGRRPQATETTCETRWTQPLPPGLVTAGTAPPSCSGQSSESFGFHQATSTTAGFDGSYHGGWTMEPTVQDGFLFVAIPVIPVMLQPPGYAEASSYPTNEAMTSQWQPPCQNAEVPNMSQESIDIEEDQDWDAKTDDRGWD